jgi:uncharacterized protein
MHKKADKLRFLKEILSQLDSVLVAYSGGVDSTLILKLCRDTLNGKVLAVTAKSPTYPSQELADAVVTAKSLSVRHRLVESKELENPDFSANSPERCYHCKIGLFRELIRIASEEGLRNIVDGSNYDDLSDYRPGMRAAAEFGVRHPLQEAKLAKDDIRGLSREMGLPTWDKPSLACLASRFPYGTPITRESLAIVEKAETFLHSLGICQLRIRHYDTIARIEVEPQDMPILLDDKNRSRILAYLKELGYINITLDLAGYRTGSMNEGVVT